MMTCEGKIRFIQLTVPEVQFGMAVATQRDACKGSIRENRFNKKLATSFGVHFAGVIGELCFRKVYGGRINTEILPNGDNHSPDILMADGRAVEVKTSLFKGPDVELKFEENETGYFKFCSLVQLSLPDTATVFPIWSWEYIEKRLIKKSYGYGPRLVFQPNKHLEK